MTAYKPSAKELARFPVRDGIMYTDLNRELCISAAAYSRRTQELAARQQWACAICGCLMNPPSFDHEDGRGMGGAHRNDALRHEDGTWRNAALCVEDNGRKGSRRYHWIDNNRQYVPKEN